MLPWRHMAVGALLLLAVLAYRQSRPSFVDGLRAEYGGGRVALDERAGRAVAAQGRTVEEKGPLGTGGLPASTAFDSAYLYDLGSGRLLHRAALWPTGDSFRYVVRWVLASGRLGRALVLTTSYADLAATQTALAVVDTRTGLLLRQVAFDAWPRDAVLDDRRGWLLVADRYDSLEILDARTGALLRRIDVGITPRTVRIDPDGEQATVTSICPGDRSLVAHADRYGWWDPRRLRPRPEEIVWLVGVGGDDAGCPPDRNVRLTRTISLDCVAHASGAPVDACMTTTVAEPVTLWDDGSVASAG